MRTLTFLIFLSTVSQEISRQGLCRGEPDDDPLKPCSKSEGVTLGTRTSCARLRLQMAHKRHQTILISSRTSSAIVWIPCAICLESEKFKVVWKFISRSRSSQLMFYSNRSIFENHWELRPQPELVRTGPKNKMCIDPKTKALRLHVNQDCWGTYICTVPNNSLHPSNYIWHHLDYVKPAETMSTPVAFPHPNNIPFKVENSDQFNQIQSAARRKLTDHKGWKSVQYGPFMLTTRIGKEEGFLDRCGPVQVRLTRQCFVRIPNQRPKIVENNVILRIYDVLRETFDFMATVRLSNITTSRTKEKVSERNKEIMDFPTYANETYLYIPCGYTLFKHLYNFSSFFPGFPPTSYHLTIKYQIQCEVHDIHRLIRANLEAAETLKFKPSTLPVSGDHRYAKSIRLVREGQKNFRLKCTSKNDLICTVNNSRVIWRTGSGVTYKYDENSDTNIRVMPDCSLLFHHVYLYEEDSYYCHMRQFRWEQPGQIWSLRPRIAYRIYIQPEATFWSKQTDCLIGLIVLAAWSLVLVVFWFILNWYDASIRKHAEFFVRSSSGRNRMIKNIYSPYMEDDHRLTYNLYRANLMKDPPPGTIIMKE